MVPMSYKYVSVYMMHLGLHCIYLIHRRSHGGKWALALPNFLE